MHTINIVLSEGLICKEQRAQGSKGKVLIYIIFIDINAKSIISYYIIDIFFEIFKI